MDTKLKRFNPAFKAAAFIIITLLSLVLIFKLITLENSQIWDYEITDIGKTDYADTDRYYYEIAYIRFDINSFIKNVTYTEQQQRIEDMYQDAKWRIWDNLTSAYRDSLTYDILWEIFERDYKDEIENNKQNLYYEMKDNITDILLGRGVYAENITSELMRDTFENSYSTRIFENKGNLFYELQETIIDKQMKIYTQSLTDEKLRAEFEREYATEINNVLYNADNKLDELNMREELTYYIQIGDDVYTNGNLGYDAIANSKYSVTNESVITVVEPINIGIPTVWQDSVESPTTTATPNLTNSSGDIVPSKTTTKDVDVRYALALSEEYINSQNKLLAQMNKEANGLIIFCGIWLLGYLICLVYLVYSAGKSTAESGEIKMWFGDKLWTEATFLLITGSAVFIAWLICALYYLFDNSMLKPLVSIALILVFMLAYSLLMSVVRNLKNRTFFKNMLTYKILALIFKYLKKTSGGMGFLFSKVNPMLRITTAVTVLGLITMIPFAGLITVPAALLITYFEANNLKKLRMGASAIKGGDYNTKIDISGKSEFALLAEDINEIAAGLSDEVDRRTKSERLKTELIVNVSHDIRTPLTSLITYADLLKKEDTDNENIKNYTEIISQKSDRLKTLTDDLFESAKAASGNINVNFEKVEINALLTQALAEFDDKIKASALEFKISMPEEKVYATADGKLLWRVIENLMSNALKYSLANSRVYVTVREENPNIIIEFKNISKTELNIPEDEITERFRRGDLSRGSEGSGLGLDIASSLMLCQNGKLKIKIDGDLFKVQIIIGNYTA